MKSYVLLLISASLMLGAAPDPFVGTWNLNVQKSKYAPGACPARMIIEMKAVGDGIHYRSETTFAGGMSTHSEYTAGYNGKEASVTGSNGQMPPVSLKRVDPSVVEAPDTKAFRVIATSRRVVSKDGRVMTITTTAQDKHGRPVTNVGVYDRIASAMASAHK